MTIRTKSVGRTKREPQSWFRIQRGQPLDIAFEVSDNGQTVDWQGHELRFRVYSQIVDRLLVLEVTDPERCKFEPESIWTLQLTEEETSSIPPGGMIFTLEHRNAEGDYEVGVRGGISIGDANPRAEQTPRAPSWLR